MSVRPAGFSSDEDEDYDGFCLDGDLTTETEIKEQLAREYFDKQLELESTSTIKLYRAIVIGNLDKVIEILNTGINIECNVSNGYTPLHLAAYVANDKIVEELIKRGANPKVDIDGFTTLMAVCNCTKNSTTAEKVLNIIKILIENGANISMIDRQRRTAFMFACDQGFIEIIQYLLPLCDLEADDNQGWTALFYAVNGNNPEVVKFLLENGANFEHLDVRNLDVKYYALQNDFNDILKIFPTDYSEISPEDLVDDDCDYEKLFENLENNERPTFKTDVSLMLYGMQCEKLIPVFLKNQIDLFKFLTLNDTDLQKLGVEMSFQRQRILQGLFRFHHHAWKKNAIPYISKNVTYTTFDFFVIITTAIKHVVIIEATLNYIINNIDYIEENEREFLATKVIDISKKIKSLNTIVKLLHGKALKFDENSVQPDMITKKYNFKKNALKKKIALSFAGISTIFLFRFIKIRFF